ncbi:MAG: glycosyltransferase family 39 protein [Desulfobacteraceae bacterium]|nr:glycosyltransferase family 39 protein [Desulfobacteraceae bacterium]
MNSQTIKMERDYSALVFWAAAFFMLFWGLGDRQFYVAEGRWAEITREMFIKHDFFHPTINWEPYFDKPLLSYWLIALVSIIIGGLNEWSLRLPSAAAGILSLWATIDLGKRLWSEEVGRAAGWILLTTYGIIFWSRTGVSDTENLAATILAVAWYWSRRERLEKMKGMETFSTCLIFYLICFIGAHAKGLTSLVIPIIALIPDIFRKGRWRVLFTPGHIAALAIGIVIYLIPFVYAALTNGHYNENGLALVFQENFKRYFEPFDHKEPFYVYFYYLPLLFMPWSPLLISAIAKISSSWRRLDENTTWLLTVFFLIFLFFTASGSRRSYYILPIFPFAALLAAVFLNGEYGWRRTTIAIQTTLVLIASIIEILSPGIVSVMIKPLQLYAPLDLKIATAAIGFMAALPWILTRSRPNILRSVTGAGQNIAPLVLSVAVIMGGLFCVQLNMLDQYRTERAFINEVRQKMAGIPQDSIAFYPKTITNLVFYLGVPGRITILKDTDAVRSFLHKDNGEKLIITTKRYEGELIPALPADIARNPAVQESVDPWERGKGKIQAKHIAWVVDGPARK